MSREELNAKIKELKKNVMLKFTADNCGPCTGLDVIIEKHEPEYDMDILIVNAVEVKDLLDLYGIMGFPTCIVLDKEGNEIDKFQGYVEEKTYADFCDKNFK